MLPGRPSRGDSIRQKLRFSCAAARLALSASIAAVGLPYGGLIGIERLALRARSRARGFVLFLRDDTLAGEIGRTLRLRFRGSQHGLITRHVSSHLNELRLIAGHCARRLIHGFLIRTRIDLEQELPLVNFVAIGKCDAGHNAGNLRFHLDDRIRLHVADGVNLDRH